MNTDTTAIKTNSGRTLAALALTFCVGSAAAVGAGPAQATTSYECDQPTEQPTAQASGWPTATEPDAGLLIGQRKARAARDVVAFAAARAQHAGHQRRAAEQDGRHPDVPPRACAKFPDLCNFIPTP